MPEQPTITPEQLQQQLIRRLDAAIIIHACEQGDIESVAILDPRRIGIEAVQEARRAIRIREATHPVGQSSVIRVMNGF